MMLRTRAAYVSEIDGEAFDVISKGGEVLYLRYKQKRPYELLIKVDQQNDEMILEFTGKILLDNYTALINSGTFLACLKQINRMGICRLNEVAIYVDSEVLKCDVTRDVRLPDMKGLVGTVRQSLSNYSKWSADGYRGGVVLEKVVSTECYKKRLTFYDKGKELAKKRNKEFLSRVLNPDRMVRYFSNKVRFELNITTKEGIRKMLDVPDTSLRTVLNSTANPILSVFDEAVISDAPTAPTAVRTVRDAERLAFLEACDCDMAKLEAKIRGLSSGNVNRAMRPYRDLMARLRASTEAEGVTLRDVRDLLQ